MCHVSQTLSPSAVMIPRLSHSFHYVLPSLSLQIDRQLQTYLQRVEAVLGKDWEKHVEGQKLKQDGDSFRQKLNTMQVRVQEVDLCS